ncbi:DUF5995 family protein [Kitasatospora sp. MAP5-34]|uniref:DUF5995 family protein n=1 Tax=Kitasatospora sp. MAP5-34 TaxID=3035102 RepID=UPI00247306A0|nr:DUF5995 family protein [Kitasatospora sp. MAP5-34]MDH6577775.1 hypothetical protein [Kitasatospora sp. MAP5-34]
MTISQVLTVDQVIERMREIEAGLPTADGVAVFNRMYLTVTELISDQLKQTYFDDPVAMAELDALFAARYLDAVAGDAAGQRLPACWRPLFELRHHPGIHPLQFALAGMNAHIEYDLPVSVLDTCRATGQEPKDVEADYQRINDLLARVEARVREELLPEPEALRVADPLLHVVGVWSVDRAREAAWASIVGFWELRQVPMAYRAVLGALDGSVGMVSRALLTPLDSEGRLPAAAGSRP